MTHEQSSAIDIAMEILQLAGVSQENYKETLRYYDDPWGAGLEICHAKRYYSGEEILSITKLSEVGDKLVFLMMVKYVNGQPVVVEFDETTAWDLYLSACLADAKENQ